VIDDTGDKWSFDMLNWSKAIATSSLVRLSVAATGAFLIVLPAAEQSAWAQGGGGGGGGRGGGRGEGGPGGMFMVPAISGQQIDRFEKMLKLTPEQMEAAKSLHEGYQDQARQIQEKLREKMEAIREEFQSSQDPSVWDGMQKHADESREARKTLDATFMSDMKLLLTPEQAAEWPSAERAVRRDQGLRRGFVSGERVDLIRLVENAKLSDEVMKTVKPALDEYEAEIDREVAKRDEGMITRMKDMAEIRRSGDMEKMQDVIEKGREASVRVRNVNRKYARQITDLLPEDQRAVFAEAFRNESFPEVYREMQGQKSFAAAMKFADLDEAQKESLQTLRGNYERELASLNKQLEQAIEEAEMTFNMAQGWGGRDRGPAGDLRRERRDLEQSTMENMKKLLKPEQVERLPKGEEQQDRWGGPGRGGQRNRPREN
jgi:hypothetical protein